MTAAVPSRTKESRTTAGPPSSADLGLLLRSILLSPRRGFASAIARVDKARPEGSGTPAAFYVLGAIGGAGLMLLWIKVGGALGKRDVARSEFDWALVVIVLAGGALLAALSQRVWSVIGPVLAARFGGRGSRAGLGVVWGASAFPQVAALLLLLPLDVFLVGSETFTTEPVTQPLARAWAALSIALSALLAVWSLFLFLRGVESVTKVGLGRAAALTVVAGLCLVVVTAAALFGASLVGAGR